MEHSLFVFWCFFAMLAALYFATHLHWFPMDLKRAYSNDNCLLPMPAPWCYAAHVCWVFCVLSFPAFDATSGAVVRVLRALRHFFATPLLGPFAFMLQEPCLHPCTPPHTGGKLGESKHTEKLKHDTFVVFQIKQATGMCVCLRFCLASRLAPLFPSPPYVAAGWHAGGVNWKKKGAKDRQAKEFWLTNLRTYQVYHVQGFAVRYFLGALFRATFCPPPITLAPFYR